TRVLAIPTLRLAHTAALRHIPALAPSLPPRQSPQSQWRAREALQTRAAFSTSSPRQAGEDPHMQAVFNNQQKFLRLMQDKPEVFENMKAFAEMLEQNGVDIKSGKIPNKMDMFRLMMRADVRERAMKMVEAFKEAGIDVQS
ncbi:uncharacterized protein BXZ73DRAFT_22461, partial [Epithele typhae]|uniref:uncharacterized protein n=1 Tax=Epithele typhae TaxID=378194 RepID=UPI0020084BC3